MAVEMENGADRLSQGFVIASLGCFKPPGPEQTGFSARALTLTRSVISFTIIWLFDEVGGARRPHYFEIRYDEIVAAIEASDVSHTG